MHRPYRYCLQRNHGSTIPRRMVFLDTETLKLQRTEQPNQWANKFRLCVAVFVRIEHGKIVKEQWFRTQDREEFWTWLESLQEQRRPLWVYAHNLHFDWKILGGWSKLDTGQYTTGPIPGRGLDQRVRGSRDWTGRLVLERSPRFWYLMGRVGRVNFVDTTNYLPKALSTVGADFNTPKLEWPGWNADTESLMTYCEQDVRTLKNAITGIMCNWWQENQGVWQPTASSLALHSFQHQDPQSKGGKLLTEIVFEEDESALHLEREGYYGAHFEAWYHGQIKPERKLWDNLFEEKVTPNGNYEYGPIHHYDVTGLYPHVMAENRYPVRRIRKENNPSLAWLRQHAGPGHATATVELSSKDETFPIRTKEGQIHAIGNYVTTLCGPELLRALTNDCVVRCYSAIIYQCEPIFTDWITYWHSKLTAARESNDPIAAEFAKMLLVSMSGKWAQRGTRWIQRPDINAIMRWGHWYRGDACPGDDSGIRTPLRLFRAIAGRTYEKVDGEMPRHCFPAISAFITSYGREYMRSLRAICPHRSVWYQAADALYCNFAAAEALRSAGKIGDGVLGKLKFKGCYTEGNIWGVNNMRLDDHTVRAGVPGIVQRGRNGVVRSELWEDLASSIDQTPDDLVRVQRISITDPRTRYKARIGNDGWTSPYWLEVDPNKIKEYLWDRR